MVSGIANGVAEVAIDRAELFRIAWMRTRQDQDARWVYDWTPGSTYGSRRSSPAAERRAVFAKHLRSAWADMRARAGFCCTNPLRDSSCESSVVAGRHEQTYTPRLQDPELARL